jgi:hypothetical protein
MSTEPHKPKTLVSLDSDLLNNSSTKNMEMVVENRLSYLAID